MGDFKIYQFLLALYIMHDKKFFEQPLKYWNTNWNCVDIYFSKTH